ncbi:MAG: MBOAT family protein [Rhodospirillales bacterium]|nr:MBOAT family protein [Rhodospirillales bacterium]
MLFNSLEFILLFLPVAVLFFYLFQKKSLHAAVISLVIFSFFYYAYWNPLYIGLLLASIIVNYQLAKYADKNSKYKIEFKRLSLYASIIFNIGLLFYFKYTDFMIENYAVITGERIDLIGALLPIGISFFTFQQIAYQIDAYKGKITEHGFWEYSLFVSFFPQLIAGPIVHHGEMLPQFKRQSSRQFHIGNIAVGLTLFAIGLFKKVVIADNLAYYASPIFDDAQQGQTVDFYAAWVAALGYTLQLYFDFSGYSDMAVGAARMFGIRLPINFFSPYKADSIIEFWRRWHISLSRFFRDYLYIPLGGNRKGTARQLTNLFLTMALVGFWHGAGWSFIIWGLYHGTLLIINHLWRHFRTSKTQGGYCKLIASTGITFLLVIIGWVFFRAENIPAAMIILNGMFGGNGLSLPIHFFNYGLVPDGFPIHVSVAGAMAAIFIAVALLIAFMLPNSTELMSRFRPVIMPRYALSGWSLLKLKWQPTIVWALFTAILLLWSIASMLSGETEFLYYNF